MPAVYLDRLLKERGISSEKISGYRNEAVSDMSSASAVFEHRANVAFGEEMIARYFPGLDFVPVTDMQMYLAIPAESVRKPGFSVLVEIVQSEVFKVRRFIHTWIMILTSIGPKLVSVD